MRQSRLLKLRQDEFIAMAGHELRTPLTAIRGFMELLQNQTDDFKGKKSGEYLSAMAVQIDRMTQLVRDLMDTSKIRNGKLVLTKTRFELGDLLDEVVKTIQPAAENHQISTDIHSPAMVLADRDRITQVITNLLTNAVKYSSVGTNIVISLFKKERQIVVSVTDSGIGISRREQERIFDPFYQGAHPIRPGRGLGLGLFISSQIIKLHRGKIWVKSELKKGSTFFFSLPV